MKKYVLKKFVLSALSVCMMFITVACNENTSVAIQSTTDESKKTAETDAQKTEPKKWIQVTFHANGGLIYGKDKLVINVIANTAVPKSIFPTELELEGGTASFVDWYSVSDISQINEENRVTRDTVFSENSDVYAMWNDSVARIPNEQIPDITEKQRNKAYVTLVFDDNRSTLSYLYDVIVGEYGLPMCAAVPAKTIENGTNMGTLKNIQNAGGEILSHGYNHVVLDKSVAWTTVDKEFADSKSALTEAGFNVNGIILVGGGGREDTSLEYRTMLETITAKYYSYSDYYGAKSQYYKPRECFYNWGQGRAKTFEELKVIADKAIEGNEWLVIYAHDIGECPLDTLRQFIDYMLDNGAEFITYKDAYTNLVEWDEMPEFN